MSRRIGVLMALVLVVGAGSGVTAWIDGGGTAAAQGGAAGAGPDDAGTTVRVTRSTITDVTALPADVVTRPTYYLRAPGAGVVQLLVPPGEQYLDAGTVVFAVGAARVTVPAASQVTAVLVGGGQSVTAGSPVLQLTYRGFGETAMVPPEAAYHVLGAVLTARADITAGPGPFDCPLVQLPSAPDSSGTTGTPVTCLVPESTEVYPGLTGTVAVTSAVVDHALVLPVAAVAGSADSGEVTVVSGGRRSVRRVGLGASNGSLVQITEGLAEGDTVLATAPGFLARTP